MRIALKEAWKGGHEGRPGYWLRFPFNAEAIEVLKGLVPYRDSQGVARHWNEPNKRWWVAEDHVKVLLPICPNLEAVIHAVRLPGFEV